MIFLLAEGAVARFEQKELTQVLLDRLIIMMQMCINIQCGSNQNKHLLKNRTFFFASVLFFFRS